MAKDPAFLFYYQDFLVGCSFLTNEEAGAYIRILSHLADKGTMSEKHMIKICKTKNVWEAIKDKFVEESNGNYYNKRLRTESQKRKEYAESRRNNRLGKTKTEITYVNHMEDEDVNENKDININKIDFELFWDLYDKKIGREKSEKKWNKLKLEEQIEAMEFIPKYKEAQPDKQYRKNPETFINNRSWKDEIIRGGKLQKGAITLEQIEELKKYS